MGLKKKKKMTNTETATHWHLELGRLGKQQMNIGQRCDALKVGLESEFEKCATQTTRFDGGREVHECHSKEEASGWDERGGGFALTNVVAKADMLGFSRVHEAQGHEKDRHVAVEQARLGDGDHIEARAALDLANERAL